MQRDRAAMVKSNRMFGLVFCGFGLVVGCLPLLRSDAPRVWAVVVAAAFGVVALVSPGILAVPSRLWLKFGEWLHCVTSPIALTFIYAVGVVPPGLLMRLIGKDPLRLKWQPKADTYWIPRSPPGRADAGLKRQF